MFGAETCHVHLKVDHIRSRKQRTKITFAARAWTLNTIPNNYHGVLGFALLAHSLLPTLIKSGLKCKHIVFNARLTWWLMVSLKSLRCLLVSFEVVLLPVCHVFCHHSLHRYYHCNQFRFQGYLCVLKEIKCNAWLISHSRTFALTLRRILTAHKTLHGRDKSKLITRAKEKRKTHLEVV